MRTSGNLGGLDASAVLPRSNTSTERKRSEMAKNKSPSTWTDKQVFTTGEAAEICKVSQQTIIRCFDNGRLQGFRVPGSRFRRIPREALLQFMKDNNIPPDALDSGKTKVLVVDDDPELVELCGDGLNAMDASK